MKFYSRRALAVVSSISAVLFWHTEACLALDGEAFTAEAVENFNHEGYQKANMEEDFSLNPSFDVAECRAAEGCNILDAAAAKAAFASERYLEASEALARASKKYKENGYLASASYFEEASRAAESAHLAFKSLSAFDANGFKQMNVSSHEELRDMFSHIDPIYLDCCKLCAKALASLVSTELYIKDVIKAVSYHESASAAAFRAYQFFYAGIEDPECDSSGSSFSSWFWGMLGY